MTRREFNLRLLEAGAALLTAPASARCGAQAPAVLQGGRPQISWGVASGDVTDQSAVIWSRTDRKSRMLVEWSVSEDFRDRRQIQGPIADQDGDFTAKLWLEGLPEGRRIFYRVRFEDRDGRTASEPGTGWLMTAGRVAGSVSFVWSGDTCGQGWGIDESRGGLRTYESMRLRHPDFFVHSGDTIYADGPLHAEETLPDGTKWRNLVTEEKSKVAQTLDEFRGNFRYNLLDANVRGLQSEVAMFPQWDDHEVLNNWYPGQRLAAESVYQLKDVDELARRARRAFLEYMPIAVNSENRIYRRISRGPLCELFFLDLRSYRGPNNANRQASPGLETAMMGREQLRWLEEGLVASRATWKFVCSDMPLGLVVRDGISFEAFANGEGPPLGRELEVAALLRQMKRGKVANVVWLTADVHYAASHYYDPGRAEFGDFDGFWEFVSGPLHAGTFGPNVLDPTFGPEVRWSSRESGAPSTGPYSKAQFFGEVRIDPRTRAATVAHFNRDGERLWQVELEPRTSA